MLAVWIIVPLETAYYGYLFGIFSLFLCLAAFLTNQFHKWAHMDTPPAFVSWLQEWGVILSREHHDIHHQSPYDTYYCITTGFWNPLLDRTLLRAGGASDLALRSWYRFQAQVRERRDPRRVICSAL